MLRINNIRIVERPSRPQQPVVPNVLLNGLVGLAAALVLGLGVAVGREQLDRSMKTPDDLERELGLSFIGLLPAVDVDDGAIELILHEKPTSGIAEAARAIRTNVMFMSPDRPYRTVLVTSAGPSEGKTMVACCFAIAMAQAGRRVVLLDCDLRRPRLHRIFGKSQEVGITTAILEANPIVSRIAQETQVPRLSVVTTGPLPPNPSEIFHSEAFAKLLEGLKAQFDCVVIDSPPVTPVTDATILSASVDGTLLVVRAFQTSKDLARRAARSLGDVGAHIIGGILNSVDLNRHEYGYRYYYYQREGYAAASQVPPPPRNGQGGDSEDVSAS